MRINAYLYFDGKTEEALNFYQSVLGGSITAMMKIAGSPAEEHFPPELKNGVLHGALTLENIEIFGSDGAPQEARMQGGRLCINLDDTAEAERIFNGLSEGGKVIMPLQQTFFSKSYGQFIDRFGTHWMVHCA